MVVSPLRIHAVGGRDPFRQEFTRRSAARRGERDLARGNVVGDRDDAHVEGLAVRLLVAVAVLHDSALDLEPDRVHPLDAVAVFRRVQAELPDDFFAFPVRFERPAVDPR